MPEQGESETLNKLIVVKLLLAITKTEVVGLSHTLSDQRESVTCISLLNSSEVPYLPVYKSIPCISRPPILALKNKFFLFLGEFFLVKLIFYLRIFFLVHYGYTKNLSSSFFYLSF